MAGSCKAAAKPRICMAYSPLSMEPEMSMDSSKAVSQARALEVKQKERARARSMGQGWALNAILASHNGEKAGQGGGRVRGGKDLRGTPKDGVRAGMIEGVVGACRLKQDYARD